MATAPQVAFDAAALELAVAELGDALGALVAHEKRPRTAPSRAAIREKARTGRLKPMRTPTTPVPAPGTGPGTATLPFDVLEDAALAAIPTSHEEPA